jgi:phosphonate transport system substrate-binding protein
MNTQAFTSRQAIALTLTTLAMILSACQPASVETPSTVAPQQLTDEQIISIGIASDDPAGTIQDFQPLADYLAKNLAEDGILAGNVVVTPDQDSMNSRLQDGSVDLFFESPFGAMEAYEAGAIPLLRRWKSGISQYHSLIVVRKESRITSAEELLGKMIAFEDPGSTSGYLLPKAYLVNLGFSVAEKAQATSPVEGNEIGYFFTGDMENSFAQVVEGIVDAAAIQSDDFEEFPQADKDQLNIVATTPDVPRHVALVSPLMPKALRDHLVDVLVGMEQTEEGKSVLQATEKTARFDRFPDGAVATLEALQELFAPIR